jgi:outer membrane receptor for ferrienterochelin and colicins
MRGVALVLALVACAAPLAAQVSATVYGTVRDSTTAAPVEGARVTVAGSSLEATTDAAGHFILKRIAAGTTVVQVNRLGYRAHAETLTLASGDSVRVNVSLAASAYGLEPVIVTAGKRSQLLDHVVASVVVLSDSDIARRAVQTADEAVDKAPGVQFLGGQVNVRGSSGFVQGLGARVLLLVDGVPANQGDRGGIDWDMIPVDQVERVEIVKGAGSSLYGSAALGGVVNLITREIPSGVHARVRTIGGTYADPPYPIWRFRDSRGGLGGLDVTGSYGTDALRLGLTAGGRHSDGYRQQDRSDTWELVGRGDWLPSAATRVRVTGSWESHQYQVPLLWCERGTCDDAGQAYQPFKIDTSIAGAYTRSDKGFFAATVEHTASPQLSWLARGSLLRTAFRDIRRPVGDSGVANRAGFELRGVVHRSDERVVTIGGEGARSDVASDVFGNHSHTEFAAYAESEQPLGSLRTTVGARIDYIAVDGGALSAVISPRLGAVLARGRFIWRASAGRGFRAPSLAERFVSTSAAGLSVVPNPALIPETEWSFELGNAAQLSSRVHSDAALFWTEARDLIEPTIEPGGVQIQFQNVQRARIAGLDLALYAAPFTPRFTTWLAYTFLYTRDDTVPTRPLAFRPKHLVTLGADYRWWHITLGGDFRFMSRYDRVELYPPTDPQVAPKVLDVRAEYRAGALRMALLAQNALNYVYNLVPRELAPVRTVSVTATWTY